MMANEDGKQICTCESWRWLKKGEKSESLLRFSARPITYCQLCELFIAS